MQSDNSLMLLFSFTVWGFESHFAIVLPSDLPAMAGDVFFVPGITGLWGRGWASSAASGLANAAWIKDCCKGPFQHCSAQTMLPINIDFASFLAMSMGMPYCFLGLLSVSNV